MRHHHIEAILREKEQDRRGCGQLKYDANICIHHLTDLCQSVYYWCHWYLVVHDCSQAHDANMHVVFLAHESGVLDGPAAGN